jgi:nitrate/nitrite-specific signal transduction histidine kinase
MKAQSIDWCGLKMDSILLQLQMIAGSDTTFPELFSFCLLSSFALMLHFMIVMHSSYVLQPLKPWCYVGMKVPCSVWKHLPISILSIVDRI